MKNRRVVSAIRHVLLLAVAALFAAPIYLAVVVASHPARDVLSGVPALPAGRLANNIAHVINNPFPQSPSLGTMMLNSLILALGVAVLKLALSVPAAYAVGFFRFPGRMVMFWLIFITLMLPVEVRFFPTYQVTANLGLLNSQGGLILPLIASATAVFLFRQYFRSFPRELADAARLDGIGPIRFLTSIVLPLARPTLAAIFVLEFIYGWNQYLWPLLVTSSPQHATVVMGIRQIITAAQSFSVPQWDLVMSVALVALIPPVLIVMAMQRWFVRGLMAGID
ncbi:MAG TPA: sn-glycerol-3-phosphate ABC transporter permease UgpE [Acidimicrobiales bacterium]|nr:sn-glycerol-3-phosphate ABC transporter permease UgpE [Acidimicrobiales bacterium]